MERNIERSADRGDPRVYFAAERTLLAWVRTALAMIGLGFVVARFGLFLRELTALQAVPSQRAHGLSLWVGVTLVVLGVILNVAAALKHWVTMRRLEIGQPLRFRRLSLGIAAAMVMGALGMVMAAYLLWA